MNAVSSIKYGLCSKSIFLFYSKRNILKIEKINESFSGITESSMVIGKQSTYQQLEKKKKYKTPSIEVNKCSGEYENYEIQQNSEQKNQCKYRLYDKSIILLYSKRRIKNQKILTIVCIFVSEKENLHNSNCSSVEYVHYEIQQNSVQTINGNRDRYSKRSTFFCVCVRIKRSIIQFKKTRIIK